VHPTHARVGSVQPTHRTDDLLADRGADAASPRSLGLAHDAGVRGVLVFPLTGRPRHAPSGPATTPPAAAAPQMPENRPEPCAPSGVRARPDHEVRVMHVTLVHVRVKPEHLAEFIAATRANHEASVREPGNVRFDVLQSADDPTRFVLYEAYLDEASAAAHKSTEHYLEWRAAVEPWMAEPRRGDRYVGLFPEVPGR
jgi:autoinducer 2-degrading protein